MTQVRQMETTVVVSFGPLETFLKITLRTLIKVKKLSQLKIELY